MSTGQCWSGLMQLRRVTFKSLGTSWENKEHRTRTDTETGGRQERRVRPAKQEQIQGQAEDRSEGLDPQNKNRYRDRWKTGAKG